MRSGRGNWGCFFFILWGILLYIFSGHFWIITIGVFIAFVSTSIFPAVARNLKKHRQENKKYRQILHELIPRVQSINVDQLEETTGQLEQHYEKCCEPYKAVIHNAKGEEINICPICGNYLRMRKLKRENDVLECINYPTCTYTRDFANIFEIEL